MTRLLIKIVPANRKDWSLVGDPGISPEFAGGVKSAAWHVITQRVTE